MGEPDIQDIEARAYERGRESAKEDHRYYTDLYFAVRRAFQEWPAMPPPYVLKHLPGTFPEDGNRGKAIQREFGSDLVPYKTECEIGAGFWDRITNGAWRNAVPQKPQE